MYYRWSRERKVHTLIFWILLICAYVCLVHYFCTLWEMTQVTPIGSNQNLVRPKADILLNQRPRFFPELLNSPGQRKLLPPIINLAVVSCGMGKLEQGVTMVKSALLFSQGSTLRVFAFADNATIPVFQKYLENLQKEFRTTGFDFVLEMKLATFPPEISGMRQTWAEIFKPCGTLRLFLPSLLPDIDSVIYLDADVLILSNLTNLWNHFEHMNSSQFIALSHILDFPLPLDSWFVRNQIPVHASRGLNCGIALMNLTKMRLLNFEDKIYQIRKDFEHLRPNSTGDQFLQNILYGQHPEYVFILSCDWNLRILHCNCKPNEPCKCKKALSEGISAIHGTGDRFVHKNRLPFFRHIYEIMKGHSFRTDSMNFLLDKLQNQFELEESEFSCYFNSSELFYSKFKKYVKNMNLLR